MNEKCVAGISMQLVRSFDKRNALNSTGTSSRLRAFVVHFPPRQLGIQWLSELLKFAGVMAENASLRQQRNGGCPDWSGFLRR